MYNYSEQLVALRQEKVRLSSDFREKLLAHRKANRDRLIGRLPDFIRGVSIGETSFRPQGSFAMQTVIQTRFVYEEYDIDDGLVLWRHHLVDDKGGELTVTQVKEKVRDALKDKRFSHQPDIHCNCVRVYYADDDAERHHVDFPIYRRFFDANGNKVRELAGETSWVASDPTQVNTWFDTLIADRNKASAGWGTQMRHLIQLLKRFCRSRNDWDLPNGMKLTMLVAESMPASNDRLDLAYRELLIKIKDRLTWNKVIQNLAHPNKPAITRTSNDQNVIDLQTRIGEALNQLATLDKEDSNNAGSARAVWDWIFKSDGFFADFDADRKKQDEKQKSLMEKAALVGAGARTSSAGILGSTGIANTAHGFYGDEIVD